MRPDRHQDDLELARQLADGDETGFNLFFGEYFPRLYRFTCARVGPDSSIAEDVVQETLTTAIYQAGQYRGEASLFSWLCTICRRTLARRERTDRRRHGRLIPIDDSREARSVLESVAAPTPTADDELQAAEQRQLVHLALDHLPERHARALEWKYLEDLPVREIAVRLDSTEKAAESLLTRARTSFQQVLTRLLGDRAGKTRIAS